MVGPIGTDWRWLVHIRRRGSEDDAILINAPIFAFLDHEQFLTIGQPGTGHTQTVVSTNGIATGSEATVFVELVNATGVVQDSGTSLDYTWDSTTNLWSLISGLHGQGLTSAQAQQLENAEANTQVTVAGAGPGGASVIQSIASLFQNYPANFTNRHGSILVSGQGAISRGTEPFSNFALGFEWHWNTLPEGVGRDLGSVDELEERIVQWRVIDEDTSAQLFQSDVIDSTFEGVRHVWGLHQPVTLEWYVIPGGVVELSFLVPALG